MKSSIVMVIGVLVAAAVLSAGCSQTSQASNQVQPTPTIQTFTIDTDAGQVVVIPICKDRVICYYAKVCNSCDRGGGMSCFSYNTIPMNQLDKYCSGQY